MAYACLLGVIGCFGSTFADAGMRLNAVSGYDRVESTRSKQVRLVCVWFCAS